MNLNLQVRLAHLILAGTITDKTLWNMTYLMKFRSSYWNYQFSLWLLDWQLAIDWSASMFRE